MKKGGSLTVLASATLGMTLLGQMGPKLSEALKLRNLELKTKNQLGLSAAKYRLEF